MCILYCRLRGGFLFCVSRLLGIVYAAGSKRKHPEHERVQFLGTTEHERRTYTHATRQKTQTEHKSVQF